MELNDYKHAIGIHIRYDDLDTFNHVNNKVYLAYLEESRIDFHRHIYSWTGQPVITFLVVRIEIDYLKPLLFGDKLTIYSGISEIGNKSFSIKSVFTIEEESLVVPAAIARVVLVNMDMESGKSVPLSEEDRNILSAYLLP